MVFGISGKRLYSNGKPCKHIKYPTVQTVFGIAQRLSHVCAEQQQKHAVNIPDSIAHHMYIM